MCSRDAISGLLLPTVPYAVGSEPHPPSVGQDGPNLPHVALDRGVSWGGSKVLDSESRRASLLKPSDLPLRL